jgi:hypothetical protein
MHNEPKDSLEEISELLFIYVLKHNYAIRYSNHLNFITPNKDTLDYFKSNELIGKIINEDLSRINTSDYDKIRKDLNCAPHNGYIIDNSSTILRNIKEKIEATAGYKQYVDSLFGEQLNHSDIHLRIDKALQSKRISEEMRSEFFLRYPILHDELRSLKPFDPDEVKQVIDKFTKAIASEKIDLEEKIELDTLLIKTNPDAKADPQVIKRMMRHYLRIDEINEDITYLNKFV